MSGHAFLWLFLVPLPFVFLAAFLQD